MPRHLVGTVVLISGCLLCACGAAPSTPTATATALPQPTPAPATAIPAAAQPTSTPGGAGAAFTFESVVAGGTTLEYAVAVPDGFDPAKEYPLLLALPPGGQDKELTGNVMTEIWAGEARKRGWVVLSPVAPGGVLFFEGAETLVPEWLALLKTRYRPAGGKYYLAGISNGGISAFRLAGEHPELFRSLTVLPGFPIGKNDEAALVKLTGMPVTMYVGEQDSSWLQAARHTSDKLKSLGGRVTLNVLPNEGHILRSLSSATVFDAIAQQ